MVPPSSVTALRESFGDRKIPEISRKVRACVACRKQKIKCHMSNENPPCARCKSRGLPCTVNRSLQMILESDAGWKEDMERRIKSCEDFLKSKPDVIVTNDMPSSQAANTSSEVSLNLSCNLGSFPGSAIVTFTLTDQDSYAIQMPDLISCSLISLEAAERYFAAYHRFMDPCVHRILDENDCLAKIRARSSFLTAAVCTVGAFCVASGDYQKCYDAYIKEVSSKVFLRNPEFDDVRALCVGAFWLNKVSSSLSALAVRMASELNLHRCITKMPHLKIECYERTRLYFIVYICDHHCSLAYGKPPMTREFRSLRIPNFFLQSEFSKGADVKLISELELWSISSRVFESFGADTGTSIANQHSVKELDKLGLIYDNWRKELDLVGIDDTSDPSGREFFELHTHCAKLFLFSHTFRGNPSESSQTTNSNNGNVKFQRLALESALAIINTVTDDRINNCLQALPSYFSTMVAFASVSLIKAWRLQPNISGSDVLDIPDTLTRLVEVLQTISPKFHPKHPLLSVGRSLRIAVSQYMSSTGSLTYSPDSMQSSMFDSIIEDNFSSTGNCPVGHDTMFTYSSGFSFDFSGLLNT
ncbi:hypothetical protein V1511DRAFT_401908 [Dipodascopsis uninucleata]